MALVDYCKAFDMILHCWIGDFLENFGKAEKVRRLIPSRDYASMLSGVDVVWREPGWRKYKKRNIPRWQYVSITACVVPYNYPFDFGHKKGERVLRVGKQTSYGQPSLIMDDLKLFGKDTRWSRLFTLLSQRYWNGIRYQTMRIVYSEIWESGKIRWNCFTGWPKYVGYWQDRTERSRKGKWKNSLPDSTRRDWDLY